MATLFHNFGKKIAIVILKCNLYIFKRSRFAVLVCWAALLKSWTRLSPGSDI